MVDFAATDGRALKEKGCVIGVENEPRSVSEWFPFGFHPPREVSGLERSAGLFEAVEMHETYTETVDGRQLASQSSARHWHPRSQQNI